MFIEVEDWDGNMVLCDVDDDDMRRYYINNEFDGYHHDYNGYLTDQQKKDIKGFLTWQAKHMEWEDLDKYCEYYREDVERFLYDKLKREVDA